MDAISQLKLASATVATKFLSWSWKDGSVLDFWTIVHSSWGIVIGVLAHFFGYSFKKTVLIGVIFTVGWEVFEVAVGVEEVFFNRVFDILLALVATSITYFYFNPSTKKDKLSLPFFFFVAILVVLSITGWFKWPSF